MNQIQVELQDYMGDDRAIANAAWTSSTTIVGKDNKTDKDVERVVRMLAESGHSVPFESVELRFWMRIPVFTDRQHMTHRIASHNGMSGRYRTMPEDWFNLAPDVEEICGKAGMRDGGNAYDNICWAAQTVYRNTVKTLKEAHETGKITNNEFKRAREFIRGVLPQAAMTERVTKMNLRAWANYIRLRLSEHAQPEIREVAVQMYKVVKAAKVAPIALECLENRNWLLDVQNNNWKKFIES